MEVKTIIAAVGTKATGPDNYRFTLAGSANYQQTGGVVMQNKEGKSLCLLDTLSNSHI